METPKLIVRSNEAERSVEIRSDVSVGRGHNNTIVLDNREVSRRHALFTIAGDGSVGVRDLGSANGTLLNGRRLIAPATLVDGDEILIGPERIVFEDARRPKLASGNATGGATNWRVSSRPQVLIGNSAAMQLVFEWIAKAAAVTMPVLIHGETGTGKELVARAIHESSARSTLPFLPLNCAAVTDALIESELFGHRRGAFTGATNDREGLFESARGGTVFLDEIGEMPQTMQAKLLRVLQEKEVTRVGENKPRPVDFRLISATNRMLESEIERDAFRGDLYYRIAAFPIELPALRDRRDDIPAIARSLYSAACRLEAKPSAGLSAAAIETLQQHHWPGNIRELENEIKLAVAMAPAGAELEPRNFSRLIQAPSTLDTGNSALSAVDDPAASDSNQKPSGLRERTDVFEANEIRNALARNNGNKTHAAAELRITYQGLLKKMRRLGLID